MSNMPTDKNGVLALIKRGHIKSALQACPKDPDFIMNDVIKAIAHTCPDDVWVAEYAKMLSPMLDISKTDIKNTIKKLIKTAKEAKAIVKSAKEKPLKHIAYVASIDRFINMQNGDEFRPNAFGRAFSETLDLPARDVCDLAMQHGWVNNCRRIVHDFSKLNESRIYEDPFDKGSLIYNAAKAGPKPMEIKAGSKEEKHFNEVVKPLLDHYFLVITNNNEAHANYLKQYCGWIQQHPGKKIRSAPYLAGPKGCGKTTFGEIIEKIVGPKAFLKLLPQTLKSNFTGHLLGKRYVFCDEAGKLQAERHNSINDWITSDTLTIEAKGKDIVSDSNFISVGMASNRDTDLITSKDERRYFFIIISDDFRRLINSFGYKASEGDIKKRAERLGKEILTDEEVEDLNARKFFKELYDNVINDTGYLIYYFSRIDVSDFNPQVRPENTDYLADARKRQIAENIPGYDKLMALLKEHPSPVGNQKMVIPSLLTDFYEERYMGRPDWNNIKLSLNAMSACLIEEGYKKVTLGGKPLRMVVPIYGINDNEKGNRTSKVFVYVRNDLDVKSVKDCKQLYDECSNEFYTGIGEYKGFGYSAYADSHEMYNGIKTYYTLYKFFNRLPRTIADIGQTDLELGDDNA